MGLDLTIGTLNKNLEVNSMSDLRTLDFYDHHFDEELYYCVNWDMYHFIKNSNIFEFEIDNETWDVFVKMSKENLFYFLRYIDKYITVKYKSHLSWYEVLNNEEIRNIGVLYNDIKRTTEEIDFVNYDVIMRADW